MHRGTNEMEQPALSRRGLLAFLTGALAGFFLLALPGGRTVAAPRENRGYGAGVYGGRR